MCGRFVAFLCKKPVFSKQKPTLSEVRNGAISLAHAQQIYRNGLRETPLTSTHWKPMNWKPLRDRRCYSAGTKHSSQVSTHRCQNQVSCSFLVLTPSSPQRR